MRPAVGSYAERLYTDLAPFAYADESLGWPLLSMLGAIGDPFQLVSDLASDSDDGPGWSALLDVDRAPAAALPWLAQFVGVRLRAGLTPEAQRDLVRRGAGHRRGSPAAMAAAAQEFLTGEKRVRIYERDGSAYRLTVVTYTAETPEPAAVEAALRAQKPAGLVLVYEVRPGQDWQSVKDHNATWQTVKDNYATWEGVRDALPGV